MIDSIIVLAQMIGRKQVEEVASKGLLQLYDLITSTPKIDDDQLKKLLYRNSTHASINLFKQKRRLYNLLLGLLIIDDPGNGNRQKYYYRECHRVYAAAKLLISTGNSKEAADIVGKSLKTAIKYEFLDIIVDYATILMRYYSLNGNTKKYIKASEVFEKFHDALIEERNVHKMYCDLMSFLGNRKHISKDIQRIAMRFEQEVSNIIESYDFYRFKLYCFQVLVIAYQINSQHEKVITTCKRAIDLFERKNGTTGIIFTFNFDMAMSLINIGNYDLAEHTLNSSIALTKKGRPNWIYAQQAFCILGFHSGKLQLTEKAIVDCSYYINKNEQLAEQFKVYQGYLNFLENHPFRLGKFLNEVPIFSSDKRGMNINILIIQVLFLLKRKEYSKVIDRADALKTYCSTYLRKDENFRSNCFIKMLLLLPKNAFVKAAVLRKAEKYVKLLEENPLRESNQHPDNEICPYETLWEGVLRYLK